MKATPDRWNDLAHRVADGVKIEHGTKLAIVVTGAEAEPAAQALVALAHRRGAIPQVLWIGELMDRAALEHATDESLGDPGPLELRAIEWADAYVALRVMLPPDESSGAPSAHRRALLRSAKGAVSAARWRQTRWAIVRVPTSQWARFAGVEEAVLTRQFLDGCLIDWERHRESWEDLATRLRPTSRIAVVSDDTDLRLDVSGRSWVVFAGEANFPDGEIATAPVEDSAVGHVTFPHRFCFADEVIENLRLEFTDGAVSAVHADRGQRLAEELIATDDGSKRIGEFGIGLNPGVDMLTGDLFFDEKILGSVHLALGRGYPECGGVNESTLHWDIVKDLRDSHAGNLTTDSLDLIVAGEPTAALTGPDPVRRTS